MRLNDRKKRFGTRLLKQRRAGCHVAGFSLTEMLVTLLILTLASTLMATGIPVAVDTYQKTVNSANAQVALSTTVTVLRSELGSATELKPDGDVLYYRCSEGTWASITNAELDEDGEPVYRCLVKSFFSEDPATEELSPITTTEGEKSVQVSYPLISDAAVTEPLYVQVGSIAKDGDNTVKVEDLEVTDGTNVLASIDTLEILVPFAT